MRDYYSVLGVKFDATKDEIKRSFIKLAHQYHPDKNNGSDFKFKEINESYQILSDENRRKKYDDQLFFEYSKQYQNTNNNNKSINKIKWYKDKTFYMAIGVFLFIFILPMIFSEDNGNNITTKNNNYQKINTSELKNYVSLNNGTIIKSNKKYLAGLGEVTIENNSNEDSLVKLIRRDIDNSIYSVYIKSNNSYTIKGVSDGFYDLLFSNGLDWDNANQKFLVSPYFSKFENGFNSETKKERNGDYINTKYSVFKVTLSPVVDGNAKTENVSEYEFNKY